MLNLDCYIEEAYEILICPESQKAEYLQAFETLTIQSTEMFIMARHDLMPLPHKKKIIRIIAILDLLKSKLLN